MCWIGNIILFVRQMIALELVVSGSHAISHALAEVRNFRAAAVFWRRRLWPFVDLPGRAHVLYAAGAQRLQLRGLKAV